MRAEASPRIGREGNTGKELPAVIGNRKALINLSLTAYKQCEKPVEKDFMQAAKFLHILYRYFVKLRNRDLCHVHL